MNVIFLTLDDFQNIEERGIYHDLMRKFRDEGHDVYVLAPHEREQGPWLKVKGSRLKKMNGVHILTVNTLKVQKTNVLEKGIGTLLIERQFNVAIKKYLGDVKFDLITYSTPPITFTNVVKYLKKKNPQAISYLQLKDIFPQNAVDIGLFGEKSVFNWYFRKKEKSLYKTSDYIGCMSPANVEFLLKHNPEVDEKRVEVAPNSIELRENNVLNDHRQLKAARFYTRKRYDLPTDKPIFIYGGNLGKPQGIDYLVKCFDANKHRTDCYFLVVGSGTEFGKLEAWYYTNLDNSIKLSVKLMKGLSKVDYDLLVRSCDVGMIFLDHRFTIPNYPSRLLSYLEYKMPVLCATDVNTDIGKIAEENGYGYWCESVNPEDFTALVDKMLSSDRKAMGEKGYEFLKKNYLVENTYNAIMKHFKKVDV